MFDLQVKLTDGIASFKFRRFHSLKVQVQLELPFNLLADILQAGHLGIQFGRKQRLVFTPCGVRLLAKLTESMGHGVHAAGLAKTQRIHPGTGEIIDREGNGIVAETLLCDKMSNRRTQMPRSQT
jgi:hypothetical protein